MIAKSSNVRPMREVGPEDEDRKAPDEAATAPTPAERTADLGALPELRRKADMMRQEAETPADDLERGLRRHKRHPGREDAGH